jgi:hypothetical protein
VFYYMWMRFSCIDDKKREWGQMYYMLNPGEVKEMIQINK